MGKQAHTILIVGAGHQQIPAIRTAKRMGLRVACVDMNPNAPGRKYSDIDYVCDITLKQKVLQIARRIDAKAVMTMQSDLPVPTVGFVNSAMQLAGINREIAECCSNKQLTRELFARSGVSQPAFVAVRRPTGCLPAAKAVGFPCIVKPADSSGSQGVSRVDRKENVPRAFEKAKRYSLSGTVMVEEHISGREVGAQTFSIDGCCQVICIHNDEICSDKCMIPVGHSYPFIAANTHAVALKAEIEKAVNCLGIRNGPANVDVIVSDDGKPYVIEVGARIGSNCLPELTSYCLGVDWVAFAIQSALGETVRFPKLGANPCAATMLAAPKDGVLSDVIVPKHVYQDPFLVTLEVTVSKGERVFRPTQGRHLIGKVMVAGTSAQSAQRHANRISKEIIVKVEE